MTFDPIEERDATIAELRAEVERTTTAAGAAIEHANLRRMTAESALRQVREDLTALAGYWSNTGYGNTLEAVLARSDAQSETALGKAAPDCPICPVEAFWRGDPCDHPTARVGAADTQPEGAVSVPLRWVDEVAIALDSASIIGARSCRPGDGLNLANHDRLIREAQQWSVYARSAKSLPDDEPTPTAGGKVDEHFTAPVSAGLGRRPEFVLDFDGARPPSVRSDGTSGPSPAEGTGEAVVRPDDCPHAAPFRYCQTCVDDPCPMGLGGMEP